MRNKYLKKYADLHIHSIYSDGTFTPSEIFSEAKKREIHCVSITDHDTVAGVEDALESVKKTDIEYIPGIEFSVNWKKSVHILAYFINHKNEKLLKILEGSKKSRDGRSKLIIEKLKNSGLNVDYGELVNMIEMTTPGRPHIARYLILKKIVKTFDEAFEKFLKVGRPGYVEKDKLSLIDTIDLINQAKGVVVLAHPTSLRDDTAVEEILKMGGIQGIEAFYTGHTPNDTAYYLKLAEKYNLFATGGTDCHGKAKEEIYMGKVKLQYKFVEAMKEYYSKM
ncbi:MAG TPA: PHP domain-containing protein [bacterium]|nr:PHP domain-containing protein [bacterium]HPN31821.1 PHP domain-containing protein [bacterium]